MTREIPAANQPIKKLSHLSSKVSNVFGTDRTNMSIESSKISSLASLQSKYKPQKQAPNLFGTSENYQRPFGETGINNSYLQNAINSITVPGSSTQVGRLAQLMKKDTSSPGYTSHFDSANFSLSQRDYENTDSGR